MSAAFWSDLHVLRMLALSPFERRRGGWRFGTRRISDGVVDRLIASGRARLVGDQIVMCLESAVQQAGAAAMK